MNTNFAEQLELDCIAGQKTLATLFAMNRADLMATVERITRGKHYYSLVTFFQNQAELLTVYRTTSEDGSNGIKPASIRLTGFDEVEITFMGITFEREGTGYKQTMILFDRYFTLKV